MKSILFNMKIASLVTLICCFSLIFETKGQRVYPYPPIIDGAKEITYKTVNGIKLNPTGLRERFDLFRQWSDFAKAAIGY